MFLQSELAAHDFEHQRPDGKYAREETRIKYTIYALSVLKQPFIRLWIAANGSAGCVSSLCGAQRLMEEKFNPLIS